MLAFEGAHESLLDNDGKLARGQGARSPAQYHWRGSKVKGDSHWR
ncbi:hypothetical protein CCP2SC5_460010 [Azospirillaceae bacterium]